MFLYRLINRSGRDHPSKRRWKLYKLLDNSVSHTSWITYWKEDIDGWKGHCGRYQGEEPLNTAPKLTAKAKW